jgi:MspA
MSMVLASAAPVVADPGAAPVTTQAATDPVADAGPPPPPVDDGRVESTPLVTTKSPDGWTLTMSAHDETQMPVPPLTNENGAREYIVGGVFNGSVHGPAGAGGPKGTLEVGYQIACGADISTTPGLLVSGSVGLLPSVNFGMSFKPGVINIVPVTKKEFKGDDPWVMISGYSIKIDGCIGQSFIRSYATLTRSTDTADVILSYFGTTKVF